MPTSLPQRLAPSQLTLFRAVSLGPVGEAWVRSLPSLVGELEERWSLEVTRSLPGGSAACVLSARRDGVPVVVKLALPSSGFALEVETLTSAGGDGYVQVLEVDLERSAVLLEALGSALDESDLPVPAQLQVLSQLLPRSWALPAPEGALVHDKAASLSDLVSSLWEDLGQPCPVTVRDAALRAAERRQRTFDPSSAVLVHGDPHPGNVLTVPTPRVGAGAGFVLVDPEPFIGDRAYDAGVVLRQWCGEVLAAGSDAGPLVRSWCRSLAASTGLEEGEVWDWALLERVSSGLFVLSLGDEELGWTFLGSALLLTS